MNINALTPSIGMYPRGTASPYGPGPAVPDTAAPRPATPVERVIEGEWLSGQRDDRTVVDTLKRFLMQRDNVTGRDAPPSPAQSRAAIDFYVSNSVPSPGRGDLDVYA